MKRLALIAVLLFLSVGAQARLVLGGYIGLTSGVNGQGVGVNIAPNIGYGFADQCVVGGEFSYRSAYNTFGVTPYFRWRFVNIANTVGLSVSVEAPMHFKDGYQSYSAFLRPGISVRVADNVSLVARVGYFGYRYENYSGSVRAGWVSRVDWNCISLGVSIGL